MTSGDDGRPADLEIALEPIVEEAQQLGASPKQLRALEQAQTEGEMTFGTLNGLFLDMVECLDAAGFSVTVRDPDEVYPGISVPALGYQEPDGLTEPQVEKLYNACSYTHYFSAQVYFVSQPVAIDAYLATFDAQREEIVECLREQERDIDSDATATELLYAVSEVYVGGIQAGGKPERCWSGSTFYAFTED